MVKEKQTRTYDQDGFRKRAACLCVRDQQELEILLVTSSRATDHWIVPGGGVEPNENPCDAAIRETEEEAGVKGAIIRHLGDFEVRDENMERKHRTSVFVLIVQEELQVYEDSKTRLRRWFPIDEALRLLAIHKPVQCHYVNHLIQTSPSLCKISSLFNLATNSMPIFSSNADSSTASSCPCKSSSDPSSTSHYLQVNHYPSNDDPKTSSNSGGGTNSSFHTLICTRDVYSTDSETAEDGSNVLESSNHFSPDVIVSQDVLSIEAICDSGNCDSALSECTKSELLSMAKSSVNS